MKTLISKSYGLHVVILSVALLLASCKKQGCINTYPEPSENPFYLTAEAQVKDLYVKELDKIVSYNPEKDIITGSNIQTATTGPWEQIKHDWVTVKRGDGVPKETVRITVTENPTSNLRIYELKMYSVGNQRPLVIIQNGKTDN